jgi:ParB family chromosome partitioning protein
VSDASTGKRGLPEQVKMRHSTHFVEDLTVRSESPIGRMIDLEQVEPDPSQPRAALGDLSELIASVEDKGVLEPILVRPHPDVGHSGKAIYRIISGERRYQAALEAGLVQVPVIEMEVGEQEALEIALVENLQRKDLTPFEEGEGYRRLAELHGYTHEEIAGAVGKSRTVVTESLALLEMPAEARDAALALGVTAKSALLEIVKLCDTPDEMIGLLEQVASHGLSRDDLRSAARALKSRSAAGQSKRPPQRRKPYTFKLKYPDKTYNLSMSFRRSTVDRGDLITALEEILEQLRSTEDPL